jgi:hypothetical protein
LRDAFEKFVEHDIKLYAISYDDQETLVEFAREQRIPFPLLSDLASQVIEQYGILNTQVSKDDAFLYGIPFPGVYVADEQGDVVAKFFHDTYKKRDSPETFINAALGRVIVDESAPSTSLADDEVAITASVVGGKGTIRQGVIRELVVQFEMADGLHIYGEPVPQGMVATTVQITGPAGIAMLDAQYPPTEPFQIAAMDLDLEVFSGTATIVVPFYAKGELASETRPLDQDAIELSVEVRYQACTENECLLPRTEILTLNLAMDVIDMPGLSLHRGHGQRESSYDSMPAMRRLIWRKLKQHPLGLPKFLWKNFKLEMAARKRVRAASQ